MLIDIVQTLMHEPVSAPLRSTTQDASPLFIMDVQDTYTDVIYETADRGITGTTVED